MLERIWKLLCSLKLTIWLASVATVLTMGGSIVMIKYPKTFGSIDQMTLSEWFSRFGSTRPALSWWLYLSSFAVVLLGINTFCCFIDWLPKFRARWRKSGEYLIHLGFVLLLTAFVWGSAAGARSEGNRLRVGETLDIGHIRPGYTLRLDAFEPTFGPQGRPDDMRSTLALLREGREVRRQTIHLNHPLMAEGLVVLPYSFDQSADGFRFRTAAGTAELRPGSVLPLPGGGLLRVTRFLPDVVRAGDGGIYPRSENLENPAFELELLHPQRDPWRGWYLLRGGLPAPLAAAGIVLEPIEPIGSYASILTVNRDPGAGLAAIGSVLMGTGVLFALASFYYKRARGDRPDIL